MKYVYFMFYKFYKCIKICHNWGYLSFGHSGAAILGPQGQTPMKRVFAFPLFHTIWSTKQHLAVYCLYCWSQSEGCGPCYCIVRPQSCLCLLHLCGEMMLVPEPQPAPIPQGEVCTSFHYIPQGRNSGMLQELTCHI